MAKRERVAFLGLGIMGEPMAANLVRAGFEVTVWNRTPSRAQRFAATHDVHVASSPASAADATDVTITMVPDVPEVESVLFGRSGAIEGLRQGGLAIDMSTIAPSASVRIGERLAAEGIGFLDAPVTGSRPRAEDATLTIMAGGEERSYERALPVLAAMGKLVVHMGPQGHGSMAKLLNNTTAAVNALALAEALVAAGAAGVDTGKLRQVMAAGSGGSAMLDLKARPMVEHDFDPLFKLAHMLKDVRHCLAEAERLGARMELGRLAESDYARADRKGLGEQDFAAVVEVVEEASGRRVPHKTT
jgi:3-hydroxyisobutyrate dehydrogenase-like beta-hydroxyacid dehydrogenase